MVLLNLLLLFGLVGVNTAPAAADPPAAATYQSSTDLMAVLATKAAATPPPELMSAPVKAADHYQIHVVRRTRPQDAIAHEVGSEIHSIIDGSATLVTGGTIVRPADGAGGGRWATIQNGVSRRVTKGDMVLVPPGTPHWYQDIQGTITYLEIRFDVGAPSGGPAIYQGHADLAGVLTARGAAAGAPPMFTAPVTSGDKYQANVVRRTSAQGGTAHELGTEVHHILEGSGTFVTGGTLVRPAAGATGIATIQGGESRHVSKGDVVLIPAGLPHWYKDTEGPITYLEVRFEVPVK
jgi:mannose-6-phosphate isomerase-like protein (cupin superfamily)